MGSVSAGIAVGTCGLIALLGGQAADPLHARSIARPIAASLCVAGETPLFSCRIGAKHVAVCGGGGGATYRFGRPGRIELASRNLTLATRGFAGGGETQITAMNEGVAYTVFDRTTRTAFEKDGSHDAGFESGLLVRRGGRTVARWRCAEDAAISSQAQRLIPSGGFVPH